jgi:Zn-dependent protease
MEWLLTLVGLVSLVLAILFVFTLRVVLAQRLPARMLFPAVDLPQAPAPLAPLFDRRDAELRALGFEPSGWTLVKCEPADLPMPKLMRLYRHRDHPVLARVSPPFTLAPASYCLVVFLSERRDGLMLATADRLTQLFPVEPRVSITHNGPFANLRDQFDAHLILAAEHAQELLPWTDHAACARRLEDYEARTLRIHTESGHLLPSELGGWRPSLRMAAEFSLRQLRGGNPAQPPDTEPVPAERAGLLFLAWRRAQEMAPPRHVQIGLFLVSGLAFAALGALFWNVEFALLLLVVIAFHEFGHFAAMRWLGYRNLQVLMLPLVGGVATGHENAPIATHRAAVSLMGPLPGILLGWLLLFTAEPLGLPDSASSLAWIMLSINYLNLLPVLPLDGGHLLRSLIPPRWFWLLVGFEFLAVPVLLLLAWWFSSLLLVLLALSPLFSGLALIREREAVLTLSRSLEQEPARSELALAVRAFDIAQGSNQGRPQPPIQLAPMVDRMLQQVHLRPASQAARAILLTIYIGALAVPLGLIWPYLSTLSQVWSIAADFPDVPMPDSAPFVEAARRMSIEELVRAHVAAQLETAGEMPIKGPDTLEALLNPGLTGQQYEAALGRQGLTAPAEYRELIGFSNGIRSAWSTEDALLWDWLPIEQVVPLADGAAEEISTFRATYETAVPGEPWTVLLDDIDADDAGDMVDPMGFANWWIIGLRGEGAYRLLAPTPDAQGHQQVIDLELQELMATRYPSLRSAIQSDWVQWQVSALYAEAYQAAMRDVAKQKE